MKRPSTIGVMNAILLVLCITIVTHAADFIVTKTADTNDGVCDSDCSLREAVSGAGNFVSDNRVLFAPNLTGSTITIGAPSLELFGAKSIVIEGPGADLLTISGGNTTSIFKIREQLNVRIAGMTLTAGRGGSPDIGGGAVSSISLSNIWIDHVHFAGNTINMPGQAGALLLAGGGNNRISNSTFSGNSAAQCGALTVLGSNTTITNTTFSGNFVSGSGEGGAICVAVADTILTLRNVTITGNSALNSGAMSVTSGTVKIGNSVIAGNTATNFPEVRRSTVEGKIISEGNNHIGDSAGDSTNTGFPVSWAGTDALNTPPALGALQNNGGRIPTILPGKGSPLINSGSDALASDSGLTADARGFVRVVGTVDKGAVETSSAQAAVRVGGRVTDIRGRALPFARVTLTDMQGNTRRAFANSLGYFVFAGLPAGESFLTSAAFLPNNFPLILVNANSDVIDVSIRAQ